MSSPYIPPPYKAELQYEPHHPYNHQQHPHYRQHYTHHPFATPTVFGSSPPQFPHTPYEHPPFHHDPYQQQYAQQYDAVTPYEPRQHLHHRPPQLYEELVRTTGLPKSLSFRKICSKCGKTRGEHGELVGFGHKKCGYQDCGKCGATYSQHAAVGQPMGVLCQLTVPMGAAVGAAAAYERRIRQLAARADLQKELQHLQRRKSDAVDRAVILGA
jgi:hypothetical protein